MRALMESSPGSVVRQRVLVVGAGGHGRSVAEIILATDHYALVGFLDEAAGQVRNVWNVPVLGAPRVLQGYRDFADAAVVAIGNNEVRERIHGELRAAGFGLVNVLHPRAIVSPTAILGSGCAIMAGAIVGTEASLGDGVIVNSGAIVDHHCVVEDFGHIGAGGSMAGGAIMGRGAWMQAGAALGYGVKVGPREVLRPGEGRVAESR